MTDADNLRLALLASRTLVGDPELEELWQPSSSPLPSWSGVADDYTPFELADAVEAVAPGGMADPLTSTDEHTLDAVAGPLEGDAARPHRRRATLGAPDGHALRARFVDPRPAHRAAGGRRADLRVLPSVLDLAAAFGSDFALGIQDAAGETTYARYPAQMAAMQAVVAARPDEDWGATVYDAWLAALEPMWLPHGEAFPDFMRTAAWAAKDHQTGFGSHAELRHDTILYTKQFVGEMGDIVPELPKVRNWVEPDPVAFGRLSAMATLTRDGLATRELMPEDTVSCSTTTSPSSTAWSDSPRTSWPAHPSSRAKAG